MVNRINEIINRENLSHAGFADEIGVQRSIISHVLNKRNKPSLDFVIKTLQKFTRINPEWLILGSGEMYKADSLIDDDYQPAGDNPLPHDLFSAIPLDQPEDVQDVNIELPMEEPVREAITSNKPERYVSQILILYSDSTYGVYKPEK